MPAARRLAVIVPMFVAIVACLMVIMAGVRAYVEGASCGGVGMGGVAIDSAGPRRKGRA